VAAALCLAGSALLLLASGRPWTRVIVEVAPQLPRSTVAATGRDLAPLAAGAGIAGLAAVAGAVATRGWLRRSIGGLAAMFGLGATLSCASGRFGPRAVTVAGRVVSEETTLWPAVGVAGGALLLVGGVLVAVRGHRWAAMGRRYDPPAARTVREGVATRDSGELWDAIDRGDDPTVAGR
jgi:uncharacterized membrane protein (TIGR02234 family)